MNQTVSIRRAEARDLPRAAELAARLVRQHHDVDPQRFFLPDHVEQGYASWFQRELERPSAVILVALREGTLVGYGYGTIEGRDWNLLLDGHGTLHDLYVIPEARQHGVGRALLEAMLAQLEALGAPRIVLSTMVSNEPAQRLFRAFGFRPTLLEMTRSVA